MGFSLSCPQRMGCLVIRAVIVGLVLFSVASPAAGQWTFAKMRDLTMDGEGSPPATGQEAALFTSLAVQGWGGNARPFESYARCLARGAVRPEKRARYPSFRQHEEAYKNGIVNPTTSFEAVLLVARLASLVGWSSAEPLFRMYAERCWVIDSYSEPTVANSTAAGEAQQADARLRRIEAADVDAGRALSSTAWDRLNIMMNEGPSIRWEDFGGVREVCLPTGAYVLAVRRYTASVAVAGIVASGQVLASRFLVADSHPRDGWWPFAINEQTCPRVIAIGGQVRIYELRTRNLW